MINNVDCGTYSIGFLFLYACMQTWVEHQFYNEAKINFFLPSHPQLT